MKVTIDKSIPDLTDEEREEIEARAIPDVDDDPEKFKKQLLGVNEFVMSEEVAAQLKAMGMTPDDLVAMMLKRAGTAN